MLNFISLFDNRKKITAMANRNTAGSREGCQQTLKIIMFKVIRTLMNV